MDRSATRCIECGGVVGSLNEDDDGTPCPACAERLLETLPGIFHSPWGGAEEGERSEVEGDDAAELEESEADARTRDA